MKSTFTREAKESGISPVNLLKLRSLYRQGIEHYNIKNKIIFCYNIIHNKCKEIIKAKKQAISLYEVRP